MNRCSCQLRFLKKGEFFMDSVKLSEKIKTARKNSGLTQKALADKMGVTSRCIQYYESGVRTPQSTEILIKLANALSVDVTYFMSDHELSLMSENELFVEKAQAEYGLSGKLQAQKLIEQAQALFAGGELDDEDKEAFLQSISDIYFDSKRRERNKK